MLLNDIFVDVKSSAISIVAINMFMNNLNIKPE